MKNPKELIHSCRDLIEAKLGWGKGESWSNHDFEKLSELIQEETKIKLSITTLKRIWDRVKSDHSPSGSTLDALAMFLKYNNWREFKNAHNAQQSAKIPLSPSIKKRVPPKSLILVFSLIVFIALIGSTIWLLPGSEEINPSDYAFSSIKSEAAGIPNSVIFKYKASSSPYDSVYIQQNWDNRRRTKVSSVDTSHTSIYYYPGYFRAKLVVGEKIVKEHDLFIASDGWAALVDSDKVPLYLDQTVFLKDGTIEVTPAIYCGMGVGLQPEIPQLRIFNVREMEGLKNDNFIFRTSVRNDFKEGTGACQRLQILILCKNDVMIIPLSSKRCIGDLWLRISEHEAGSSQTDLSGFGTELSEWTDLRVESADSEVRIFVNDTHVYTTTFSSPASEIVGVQYRFEGLGAIRNTLFSHKGGEFIL